MSDYETTQKKRNTVVGVFVVMAICALVALVYKFGDLPIFVSRWTSFDIRVQFAKATGIQENTPVRFAGYQIGKVTDVKPPTVMRDLKTGKFYHQSVVILSIDKKYDNIPAKVEIKLMTRGLGSSYIEFETQAFDVMDPDSEFLNSKSLVQGSTGMTSEFFPEESQKKLGKLVDGLDNLITNANDIIGNKENKENINAILANMSEATKEATEALKQFRRFSAVGAETLKNVDVQIETVATALVGMNEELTKTITQLRLVLEKVNSGEGTAGKLINDARLYENLLENSQQLQILMKELMPVIEKMKEKGITLL